MPTYTSPDLRRVIDWQTGVRGYLDYQDEANKQLLQNFDPILQPSESNFDAAFYSVMEAAKFAVASELKVRENRRLAILGRPGVGIDYHGTAVEFNSQAIKSANRARRMIEDLPPRLRELNLGDAGPAALDDARTALTQSLVKFNVMEDDFRECLQIWDEVADQGRVGAGAVLDQMASNLQRFTELRSQTDRGTSPHSPLPWWKYVVIAIVLGAAIFGIIACFWWSACTWIWPAISAVAPWVFGMIDRGC